MTLDMERLLKINETESTNHEKKIDLTMLKVKISVQTRHHE